MTPRSSTRRTTTRRAVAMLFTIAALLGACGEDNEVGDDALFDFDPDQADALGGSTTVVTSTTAPEAAEATTTTAAQSTATTAVQQTTTTVAAEDQEVSEEVLVRDDGQDGQGQFTPNVVQIRAGGTIRFKNIGSQARTIVFESLGVRVGPIAPGAVEIFKPEFVGDFNYTDDTRPYAGGKVVVYA
jgi:plastocyanin